MKNFKLIAENIPVDGVLSELAQHPKLWGAHPGRTQPSSPHYGVPDIWVRFRHPEELTCSAAFREPHKSVFYPAWDLLPALRPIVGYVTNIVPNIKELGGILITKIPAGGQVKPHNDKGGWHAEYYNTKVYVALQSNSRCDNWCENEVVNMKAGDAITFNNLLEHSVENEGHTDRITLIICLRTEP